MELSSILGTMLSEDSVKNISKAAGVAPEKVQSVLGSGLPSLLNGALAQARGGDTAEGFLGALKQHAGGDLSNLGAFLGKVDLGAGAKIVGHLLGQNSGAVQEISNASGVSQKDTGSILAAAAPLLMSLLGQQTGSQQGQSASAVSGMLGGLLSNVDMGSMIMGLLGSGGTSSGSQAKPSGGILGALGGLLK